MGKRYPWHMRLPEQGFMTLLTDGKMQTFTLKFLWRNLIHSSGEMAVGSLCFNEDGEYRYFNFCPFPAFAVCRVALC